MSAFPQNYWYVAAWSKEVGRKLLSRTICGEPVVFYRSRDGQPVALADRCVHRRYPLSLGKLQDDSIECGYHGFVFDCSGTCTFVPGQDRVPRTARVPRYQVVERDKWIWIWIGDQSKADPALVPDAHWLDDPEWASVEDMAYSPFRYSLLMDNLMDLSHETYLHAGLIGTPEIARTPFTTHVDNARNRVTFSRHMEAVACPPFYEKTTGYTTPIDRWQDVAFQPPAFWVNNVRVAPQGTPVGPNGDEGGAHVKIVHGLTPETENSTWDFWAVVRDFALDDDSVSDALLTMNQEVVQQDLDALTVLEQVVANEPPGTQELSVEIDAGGLAARAMLRKINP
ncbi:aromatic ring-hydroxylating dioxygenase subunit alpha [Streptomyces sp. NBC_01431]|uniref:aromatic ring-hydroxylating dioxygenase subunit alpha n=1 Tax=Streptomyces sp. NBC_01431 TaxID=2903863 RepID=UPI002E3093FA|nr:aromatic ring-hydroxylating dioxygenase subunit alpha [Streptomyces sp. NBC_01431]